jgi:branched-chain amino acid transport system permease protein
VLGGWILGVLENLVGGYVSTAFKSVVAFLVIVLVLCIRPSGLFARHYERKV